MLKGLKAVAAAAAMVFAANASADQLFDFTTDPLTGPPAPVVGYTPAPMLNNGNAAAVSAFLAGQPVKAVKVQEDLLPATVASVYNPNNVRYTFADYEGPTATARALALRTAIAGSAGTGPALLANTSYIGNFNIYPVLTDPTRPTNVVTTAASYQAVYSSQDYFAAGLNMSNEALYPGAPDFRTSSTKNGHVDDGLGPNIRSELFTLPIIRTSLVTANLPTGHKHIPYVNRFNNYGNSAFDTDGNSANGFRWTDANGQMISRGDFSAMVAHYRARGVHGVHLLDGGVEGYGRVDHENDAKAGWEQPELAALHNAPGSRIATLDTVARVDGTLKSIEESGVVFSGVYNLTQGKLALLVSNMDEIGHQLTIQNKIGGKNVPGNFNVPAGTHQLLQFTSAGTFWQLLGPPVAVFTDADRNGVGVPEPTTLGALAIFSLVGLRRRRKA
jgi:hypothetical protein